MSREPTMTRKHFELIAGVINALDFKTHWDDAAASRLWIAHDFARALGIHLTTSGALFLDACTVSDRKRAAKAAKKLTNRAEAVDANARTRAADQRTLNDVAARDNPPGDERFDH